MGVKGLQFKNGNVIINHYSADGQKQRSDNYTRLTAITPVGENTVVNPENGYSDAVYSYTGTAYIGAFEYSISKTKSYVGNGVYLYFDAFAANKIYTPEGYIDYLNSSFLSTGLRYNYYRKDHLGNIREVWNGVRKNYSKQVKELASTRQRTQYYPSGLPWAESIGAAVQKHKYNDKEFIEMHGLDEYDSEARWYYPAIMRTTTIDPLAEKYYSISPYAWCLNNPVNAIDPDGKFAFLIPVIPYVVPVVKAAVIVGAAYFGAKTVSEVSTIIRENRTASDERTDNAKATTPQQQRRAREQEARSKQETADIKNNHQKMNNENNGNGDGSPKRDIKKAAVPTVIATGLGMAADLKDNIPKPEKIEPLPTKVVPITTPVIEKPKPPSIIPLNQ